MTDKRSNICTNAKNDGRKGINGEASLRYAIADYTGQEIIVKSRKGAGKADIKVRTASKATLTIEVKTGCGQLTAPIYTEKQVNDLLADTGALVKAIAHTKYIAYCYDPEQDDFFIMPKAKFIEIFSQAGILRKKAYGDKWAITIQSYKPTPTFRASKATYNWIQEQLFDCGEYLDCFLDRLQITTILDEVEG